MIQPHMHVWPPSPLPGPRFLLTLFLVIFAYMAINYSLTHPPTHLSAPLSRKQEGQPPRTYLLTYLLTYIGLGHRRVHRVHVQTNAVFLLGPGRMAMGGASPGGGRGSTDVQPKGAV
jgi:hypothetical protein